MSELMTERRRGPGTVVASLGMAVVAMVLSWLVITQLGVWFGYLGVALALPVLVAVAAAVWVRSQFGPAWVAGAVVGALPTFVFLWFFF